MKIITVIYSIKRWSMLRNVCNLYLGININTYMKLKMFIKNKAKGYHTKKAKVLTLEEVTKFLNSAPDEIYLGMKVILIFGICGALRSMEIANIKMNDVQDTKTQFIVTIKDTKNCYPRSFIIGEIYYDRVKQYISLRPKDIDTDRFFLFYMKFKCTRNVIGKNKIAEVPKNIACYLNLPDPNRYTGHCFRRTSATLLANSGATLTTIKEHGGWRSSAVAEGYIEHSLFNKNNIFNKITQSEKSCTVTKDLDSAIIQTNKSILETNCHTTKSSNNQKRPLISIENYKNVPTYKKLKEQTTLDKNNNNSNIMEHDFQETTNIDHNFEIVNEETTLNIGSSKQLEQVDGLDGHNQNSHISGHNPNISEADQLQPPTIQIKSTNDLKKKNNDKNNNKIKEEIPAIINIKIDKVETINIYYGKNPKGEE
ncbi:uncharacterized protein [Chelonus insularis]|uniref:uncharacterized protein isoform X2 n=1 Tax=Chelonus insularis TaxID=460826 RepID=UPI00158C5619|nr:uncharacterized protein LOC118067224 isoform X2 [Chelonus insularis]XP_034948535.1 uncharacterized protein LOC118072628 isoform X1 [Chelonus insularis]